MGSIRGTGPWDLGIIHAGFHDRSRGGAGSEPRKRGLRWDSGTDRILPDRILPDRILPGRILPGRILPDRILPGRILPGRIRLHTEMPHHTPPTWTGPLMDPSWIPHGSPMHPSWIPHGSLINPPWIHHGFPMDPPWIPHDSLGPSWIPPIAKIPHRKHPTSAMDLTWWIPPGGSHLRQGTPLVCSNTGGLGDRVQHYSETTRTGNGLVFDDPTHASLLGQARACFTRCRPIPYHSYPERAPDNASSSSPFSRPSLALPPPTPETVAAHPRAHPHPSRSLTPPTAVEARSRPLLSAASLCGVEGECLF